MATMQLPKSCLMWLCLTLPAPACSSRREVRATALAVLQWRAASLPTLEVELCHNTRLLRELLGGMDEGVHANALAILASLLPKLRGQAVGAALTAGLWEACAAFQLSACGLS